MKGRKPKPASIQAIEGDPSKRGKHKLQELMNAEPPATKGLPECPDHLTGIARDAWIFWADELAKMNLDCRCDGPMLEAACFAYQNAIRAEGECARDGQTFKESVVIEGEVVVLRIKAHPAVAVRNQAWRLVHRFCTEFGLSPVSRTRLTIDKQDKLPDLAKLLSEPRKPREAVQ